MRQPSSSSWTLDQINSVGGGLTDKLNALEARLSILEQRQITFNQAIPSAFGVALGQVGTTSALCGSFDISLLRVLGVVQYKIVVGASLNGLSETTPIEFSTTNCTLQYRPTLNHGNTAVWLALETTLIVANPTADTIDLYVRLGAGTTSQFVVNAFIEPTVNFYAPN